MIQEIITSIIVGLAVIVAGKKIFAYFRKRKTQSKRVQKENAQPENKCSSCSAECILRELPKQKTVQSTEVCNKIK